VDEKERLIQQLDKAREAIRAALARTDPQTVVNPGWKTQELLAHLAGWDAVTSDALCGHAAGVRLGTPAKGGIDAYNARSVEARRGLSYEQAVADWEQAHDGLRQAVAELPAEKLTEKLVFPWGGKGTVARIVAIMTEHEREHARELQTLS
jgi:uncharacterized protein (TIGR03083 family)